MENGNRLRLLYIYQHLFRYSDAEHPVTTPELIRYLKEEHGMYVNRTTLPSDFAMMEKAGLHFKVVRSRQNKYYFDGRLFDIQAISIQDKNSVNGNTQKPKILEHSTHKTFFTIRRGT